MTTQQHDIPRSTVALIITAGLGIIAPFPFLALLGSELGTAELWWILGSISLAGLLALGLIVRLRTNRPLASTALLIVGAFAPSAAWCWIPPVYLLTAAVIIIAVATIRTPALPHSSTT